MSNVGFYIARKSCGCMVAAAVDHPGLIDEVARFVAKMIRDGMTVEHVDDIPAKWSKCPHKPPPEPVAEAVPCPTA